MQLEREEGKETQHSTYGKQQVDHRDRETAAIRKSCDVLTKPSLPPSSGFHSLGLGQAHFLYNQDSLTRQLHCWIFGVLFKSTLPALIYSILKTRPSGRYYFVHFTDETEAQRGKVSSKHFLGFEPKQSVSRPLNPQAAAQKSNLYAHSATFIF